MSSDHLIADLGDGDHGYHFAIEPFLERSVIWLQNAETNEIWFCSMRDDTVTAVPPAPVARRHTLVGGLMDALLESTQDKAPSGQNVVIKELTPYCLELTLYWKIQVAHTPAQDYAYHEIPQYQFLMTPLQPELIHDRHAKGYAKMTETRFIPWV